VAVIRLEAIEQRREFLAELERPKQLERAGRVLAAREERHAGRGRGAGDLSG
jgi:hypothetical protein